MKTRSLSILTLLCLFALPATSQKAEPEVSAEQAQAKLAAGNKRFAGFVHSHPNQNPSRRAETAIKQKPFAIILTCADSRVAPEFVFDQGIGDLFVVRVAGNIADDAIKGSIEYAVEHLGVHLVVVMGHERCGAVDATLKGGAVPGHIHALTDSIAPAIAKVKGQPGDPLENAIKANVQAVVEDLRSSEPILNEGVHAGKLKVVGAYYDLDSGKIAFLSEPKSTQASGEKTASK